MARTGRLPPADISSAKARALKTSAPKQRPAVKKQAVVRSPKDAMIDAPGGREALSPRSVVKALQTLHVAILKLEIVNVGPKNAGAVLGRFESVQALAKLQAVVAKADVKNKGPSRATDVLVRFESVQALTKLQVAMGEAVVKNPGPSRATAVLARFDAEARQ